MASGCQAPSQSPAVVLNIRACTAAPKILVYQRWRSSPLGKAEVVLDFISNLATHNLEVRGAMIDVIDHLQVYRSDNRGVTLSEHLPRH